MSMRQKTAVRTVPVLAVLLAATFLALAASASAQSPGLDQYTESIPGAGGNKTTDKGDHGGNGGGDGGGSTSGPTLDSSQLDDLRSQGKDGERAAAALEATSGSSDSKGDSNGSSGDSSGGLSDGQTLDPAEAEGKAPVAAILSSMFGGGGAALPLIMLAVLIGGLVIAARKRSAASSIDD